MNMWTGQRLHHYNYTNYAWWIFLNFFLKTSDCRTEDFPGVKVAACALSVQIPLNGVRGRNGTPRCRPLRTSAHIRARLLQLQEVTKLDPESRTGDPESRTWSPDSPAHPRLFAKDVVLVFLRFIHLLQDSSSRERSVRGTGQWSHQVGVDPSTTYCCGGL